MIRRFASVLAGLTLAGTIHAGAMAGPVTGAAATGAHPAVIVKINSTGWGSRLNKDRFYDGDEPGYGGAPGPYGYGEGYGYGPVGGRAYRAPPGYGNGQPFYGEPRGYDPYEAYD